jgi:phenylalanyl-tRNA synthetase alpha chain
MLDQIIKINQDAINDLQKVNTAQELDDLRLKYLSRKGIISSLFSELKNVEPEKRGAVGQKINQLKNDVESSYKELEDKLKSDTSTEEDIDLFLPGRKPFVGRLHPLTQVLEEIKQIFFNLGFRAEDGPEIETDFFNFEALNIPKDHPARDMQDTLYITEEVLLRTHTSPVQIRTMQSQQPPISIIAPGRVYRRDTPDASHSPFFHQVEGLVVDKGISFGDLKGVVTSFAHKMFGSDIKVRFRPSFFPFTEPSAEYDFNCVFCRGKGCRVCKNTGWVEISGAGMVDPNVFKAVGYDSEKYTGYAFGMGVDRIAMLKYGINDIRLFFENDLRFLEQF